MWVIGDSSVCWCARVAGSSPWGERLNRLAYIHWMGRRRLQMFQFSDFLLEAWSAVPILPDVIILQFGANDLGLVHKHLLSILARQCINLTREALPHTVIFYSELLPRQTYPHALKQSSLERTRRSLNAYVHSLFRNSHGLFHADEFHLTDDSCSLILHNFYQALAPYCLPVASPLNTTT